MWIVSTHIGISCLIYVAAIGLKVIFKERLQRFKEKKKVHFRRIKFALIMFVPLVNVIMLIGILWMIGCSDEDVKKIMDKQSENKQ